MSAQQREAAIRWREYRQRHTRKSYPARVVDRTEDFPGPAVRRLQMGLLREPADFVEPGSPASSPARRRLSREDWGVILTAALVLAFVITLFAVHARL
jgi:hypothetical protein